MAINKLGKLDKLKKRNTNKFSLLDQIHQANIYPKKKPPLRKRIITDYFFPTRRMEAQGSLEIVEAESTEKNVTTVKKADLANKLQKNIKNSLRMADANVTTDAVESDDNDEIIHMKKNMSYVVCSSDEEENAQPRKKPSQKNLQLKLDVEGKKNDPLETAAEFLSPQDLVDQQARKGKKSVPILRKQKRIAVNPYNMGVKMLNGVDTNGYFRQGTTEDDEFDDADLSTEAILKKAQTEGVKVVQGRPPRQALKLKRKIVLDPEESGKKTTDDGAESKKREKSLDEIDFEKKKRSITSFANGMAHLKKAFPDACLLFKGRIF